MTTEASVVTWPYTLRDYSAPVKSYEGSATLDVVVGGASSGSGQVTKPMRFTGFLGNPACGSKFCQCRRFRGMTEENSVRKAKPQSDENASKGGNRR